MEKPDGESVVPAELSEGNDEPKLPEIINKESNDETSVPIPIDASETQEKIPQIEIEVTDRTLDEQIDNKSEEKPADIDTNHQEPIEEVVTIENFSKDEPKTENNAEKEKNLEEVSIAVVEKDEAAPIPHETEEVAQLNLSDSTKTEPIETNILQKTSDEVSHEIKLNETSDEISAEKKDESIKESNEMISPNEIENTESLPSKNEIEAPIIVSEVPIINPSEITDSAPLEESTINESKDQAQITTNEATNLNQVTQSSEGTTSTENQAKISVEESISHQEPVKTNPSLGETPEPSPQPSPSKAKPETPEKAPAPDIKADSKPGMIYLSKEDLAKWNTNMTVLETKLKKTEEELEEMRKIKTELGERLQGMGAVQKAEREALKENEEKTKLKCEALEQKNKSLVQMLDQAEVNLQQNTSGKGKDIEAQREVLRKQLIDKKAETEELRERYRKESLVEKELNLLRTEVFDTQRTMEKLEASIVQLKRKEIETAKRKEAERLDQEAIESMKLEISSIQEQSKLLETELGKLRQDALIHTQDTLKLSTSVEELQLKEKNHEVELENETKPIRDEVLHYKKVQTGKDLKLKELERENEEMKKMVSAQEAEISTIANQLRAASQLLTKPSASTKRTDKLDMKMIEALLQEKKELKAEVDKLSRETGRLDVIIRDLDENIDLRKHNIQVLLSRYSELEMIDKVAAAQVLVDDASHMITDSIPQMSNSEVKKLMEKVILQNIYLKQRIPKLESQLETLEIS
jgi:hypothetical protein